MFMVVADSSRVQNLVLLQRHSGGVLFKRLTFASSSVIAAIF